MREKFTLDHLSDTEFEEYCYDLLKDMGFKNVQWRKGTGFDASPSDQGRDIECDHVRHEIDGEVIVEKWFVQCKRYKAGVPPDKINGALAWTEAERPQVLLLIASNFFSNPTKEFLKNYKNNTKPSFRIKVWELPDLENNSKGKPLLLSKYGLSEELEFLNIMHPAHLQYIKSTQVNTLDFLFELMDKLEEGKRNEIVSWLYLPIIRPRYRKATSKHDTLGDLKIDPTNYEILKQKCYEIERKAIGEVWIAPFLVNYLLQATFAHGNLTEIDQMVQKNKDLLEHVEQEVMKAEGEDKKPMQETLARFKKHTKEMPKRIHEGHRVYQYFCDEVISILLYEHLTIWDKYAETQD